MQSVKCVFVGDGSVGKTSLLMTYTRGIFPTDHVPTVFDNYAAETKYNGQSVILNIWDTAGQEEYARLRVLSYVDASIFVICFSLVDRDTLDHVRETWYPEVHYHAPCSQLILVGTKLDLRETSKLPNSKKNSTALGKKMASEIGAVNYVECSAKTKKGLDTVFDEIVKTSLTPRKRRSFCVLL